MTVRHHYTLIRMANSRPCHHRVQARRQAGQGAPARAATAETGRRIPRARGITFPEIHPGHLTMDVHTETDLECGMTAQVRSPVPSAGEWVEREPACALQP